VKLLIETFFFFVNIFTANPDSFIHNGLERKYYLFKNEEGNKAAPLIVNLHGYGSNARQQRIYSQMNKYALKKNISIVYPEGINRSWNVGWDVNNKTQDIGFIYALLDTLIANYNIDTNRIYVCGFSNGGMMVNKLALEPENRFAAFGNVAGILLLNEDGAPKTMKPTPMMHIHGTEDRWVPYYDKRREDRKNVQESLDYWIDHNNLNNQSEEIVSQKTFFKKTSVKKYTYYSDEIDTKVVHYQVDGGGHQWFGTVYGSNFLMKNYVGRNNNDFHSSQELVDFFLNYKLDKK